jgi:hypothetical protein
MNHFHLQWGMEKLPPLVELRAFDAAARHLSFLKAAAELGVTPTAISHQIAFSNATVGGCCSAADLGRCR